MKLQDIKKNFDFAGNVNPFENVITDSDGKHIGCGNIKWGNKKGFYKLGEKEMDGVMRYLNSMNLKVGKKKALDFGCGCGRTTQGMAKYFEKSVGVDIAKSMVDAAKKHNLKGDKCDYLVNTEENLMIFPDNHFDFVYSTHPVKCASTRYSMEKNNCS